LVVSEMYLTALGSHLPIVEAFATDSMHKAASGPKSAEVDFILSPNWLRDRKLAGLLPIRKYNGLDRKIYG